MSLSNALRVGMITALSLMPLAGTAQTASGTESLPVGETPVGEVYIAETHGDWEIRCIRAEEGQPEPCQLYQLLRDANGGAVAEFNIFDVADEGPIVAGATIITPIDTLLTPGIRLRVDEGTWSEYPFAFCQPIGCFARLGLTAEDLARLQGGSSAFIALVPLPAPDQVIELASSLAGLTAGFAALQARMPAAAQ